MNGDEDLGEDISMKGDKFHFNQYLMMDAEPEAKAPATANATASAGTPAAKYPAPEKVHTLDPKIAKAHTTFYNKNGKKGANDNTYPVNDEHMSGYVYEHTAEASDNIPHVKAANPPSGSLI
jgi:hypothetical protein